MDNELIINQSLHQSLTLQAVDEEMESIIVQSVAQKYDNTLKINWTHKDRTQNK